MISKSPSIPTPVLFIGGLAMRGAELQDLMQRLSPFSQSPLMAFDNINVGAGPRKGVASRDLSIFDQAVYQWEQVHQHLGANDQRISLFGISMGGMIAATMAYLKPERVDRLLLAATSANLPGTPAVPEELYQTWTQIKNEEDIRQSILWAFGKTTLEKHPEIPQKYCEYRISGGNRQIAREFLSQLHSIRQFEGEKVYKALAQSNIQITVLTGEEDVLFDSRQLSALQLVIPRAKYQTFAKTGHMLHLENPELLAKTLLETLTET